MCEKSEVSQALGFREERENRCFDVLRLFILKVVQRLQPHVLDAREASQESKEDSCFHAQAYVDSFESRHLSQEGEVHLIKRVTNHEAERRQVS